MNFEVFYHCWL